MTASSPCRRSLRPCHSRGARRHVLASGPGRKTAEIEQEVPRAHTGRNEGRSPWPAGPPPGSWPLKLFGTGRQDDRRSLRFAREALRPDARPPAASFLQSSTRSLREPKAKAAGCTGAPFRGGCRGPGPGGFPAQSRFPARSGSSGQRDAQLPCHQRPCEAARPAAPPRGHDGSNEIERPASTPRIARIPAGDEAAIRPQSSIVLRGVLPSHLATDDRGITKGSRDCRAPCRESRFGPRTGRCPFRC